MILLPFVTRDKKGGSFGYESCHTRRERISIGDFC